MKQTSPKTVTPHSLEIKRMFLQVVSNCKKNKKNKNKRKKAKDMLTMGSIS